MAEQPGVLVQAGADVLLRVKAVPGARRNEIAGVLGDRLKVRVSAPPEGGKANAAICEVISEAVGIKATLVSVERGASSAEKLLRLRGVNAAATSAALKLT